MTQTETSSTARGDGAPETPRGYPGFWSTALALVRKDLKIETRARDTLPPMLAFSLAVTLLLAFTLPESISQLNRTLAGNEGVTRVADVIAGFVWVTVLFAGLIGFARTFESEREEGALETLLLAPIDRSALFVGKAVANLAYLAIVQVFLFPVFVVLWSIDLGTGWLVLILVVLLVDLGFVSIGTLFASLAAQTRSRELVLPILALPALVPVFIAAVELTSDLFVGGGVDSVTGSGWFGILVGFDIIFGVVGAIAFDYILD